MPVDTVIHLSMNAGAERHDVGNWWFESDSSYSIHRFWHYVLDIIIYCPESI